ncbi:hypothetical protein CBL_10001, partial [Carabus blaptoides fortunei]
DSEEKKTKTATVYLKQARGFYDHLNERNNEKQKIRKEAEKARKKILEAAQIWRKTLKNCRKEKQTTLNQLKDKRGRLIKEDNAIMERWKKHFYQLLEGDRNRKEDEESRNVDFASITNIERENISRKEIQSVPIKQRRDKAPEHDNMRSELLKYMGEESEDMLLKMLNIKRRFNITNELRFYKITVHNVLGIT